MELDTKRIGPREEEYSYHWKQYIHGRLCRVEEENERISKASEKIGFENVRLTEGVKELRERLDKASKKFTQLQEQQDALSKVYDEKIAELKQIILLQEDVIESIKERQGDLVE